MIDTKLTISKPQGGNKKYISIAVVDADALVEFVEVHVSLEDLMDALTGLGRVPCTAVVRDLDKVGKKKESWTGRVSLPVGCGYGEEREEIAYKLACEEYGDEWHVSKYFGSQSSFETDENRNTYANVALSRWVYKKE